MPWRFDQKPAMTHLIFHSHVQGAGWYARAGQRQVGTLVDWIEHRACRTLDGLIACTQQLMHTVMMSTYKVATHDAARCGLDSICLVSCGLLFKQHMLTREVLCVCQQCPEAANPALHPHHQPRLAPCCCMLGLFKGQGQLQVCHGYGVELTQVQHSCGNVAVLQQQSTQTALWTQLG